jgi:DNA-directed RNA polymerase specialized sigma24 family protein
MDLPIAWTELEFRRRVSLRRDDPLEREQEFSGIVERQARFMFRVAYSLLRNVQDAEDAVQEAFLKLYRGEAWRRMEDEKAFLARTVWRVALDRAPRLPTGWTMWTGWSWPPPAHRPRAIWRIKPSAFC